VKSILSRAAAGQKSLARISDLSIYAKSQLYIYLMKFRFRIANWGRIVLFLDVSG
jgi:hypothetical protein